MILLPVALDLLLWFGPHLRIKALADPTLAQVMQLMRQTSTAEMKPLFDNVESLWQAFINQFNVLSLLSTFPIGLPSMVSGLMPMQTPLGAATVTEVGSFGGLFLGWLGLTLLGFGLGSLYFDGIARSCSRMISSDACPEGRDWSQESPAPAFRLSTLAREMLQVLAMVALLVAAGFILMVPAVIISSLLALLSPIAAQFALLLFSFSLIWFLIPLIFSPHGIFMCGQSVFRAMLNSMRLVRQSLPGTGLFLLALLVLNQGLGVLWNSPPDTSWMMLIGIFGHAFVVTSLLAASFVYYRTGLTYLQELRKLAMQRA